MSSLLLNKKIIIITGAAGGLGQAMVEGLLTEGATILAADQNEANLKKIQDQYKTEKFFPFSADLRDPAICAKIPQHAIEVLGGLHGLINNAGVGLSSIREDYYVKNIKFWEVTDQHWQRIFDVNARAPFLLSKAAIPHFLKQGWGRIVNITTSMDTMIRRGWTPYGPSKGALEAQSACWAKDVEGTGVTVNVLVPGGPANTAMVPVASSPDREAMVQPEILKRPICWLMSKASNGFNGKRMTGTGWNEALPEKEAANKAAAPAAWPGAGQQSVWPDLTPPKK